MLEFLAHELLITDIIISLCSLIYASVLISVVLFRPKSTRSKRLWYLTGLVFLTSSISRMMTVFLIVSPGLFPWYCGMNFVLAVLLLILSVDAWFQIDTLFAYNLPESIQKEVIKKLRKEIFEDSSFREPCSSKRLSEVLERLEKDKSFFR